MFKIKDNNLVKWMYKIAGGATTAENCAGL
jgi:hypothetical protein